MNAHQRRKLRRLECREGRGQATMRTEDGRVLTLEATPVEPLYAGQITDWQSWLENITEPKQLTETNP